MMREATEATGDADLVLFLSDPLTVRIEEELEWFTEIREKGKAAIVAINKIDKLKKEELLPLIEKFSAAGAEAVIPVSALDGNGVDILVQEIESRLPRGPRFYPDEMVTERSERFIVSETIREKVFRLTHDEVPYSCLVRIEKFEEKSQKLSVVYASICVAKESQKGIVIGKGGAMIKRIGQEAREDMERQTGRKFFLDLKVKTVKEWTRNEKIIRDQFRDSK
jgi:GTP-binding protein Era